MAFHGSNQSVDNFLLVSFQPWPDLDPPAKMFILFFATLGMGLQKNVILLQPTNKYEQNQETNKELNSWILDTWVEFKPQPIIPEVLLLLI